MHLFCFSLSPISKVSSKLNTEYWLDKMRHYMSMSPQALGIIICERFRGQIMNQEIICSLFDNGNEHSWSPTNHLQFMGGMYMETKSNQQTCKSGKTLCIYCVCKRIQMEVMCMTICILEGESGEISIYVYHFILRFKLDQCNSYVFYMYSDIVEYCVTFSHMQSVKIIIMITLFIYHF